MAKSKKRKRNASAMFAGAARRIGRGLTAPVHLPGLPRAGRRPAPGTPPGIEGAPQIETAPPPEAVAIRCIDYNATRTKSTDVPLDQLDAFLAEPRPPWSAVRWINVNGLHPNVIDRFRQTHRFHTLAAEDVLHVPQRPKAEPYGDHLFFVARMLTLHNNHLESEQVSMFLYPGLLLTFQERPGDVWQPIRERIEAEGSRVRQRDAGYLMYALLDAIVDHCFPILERYGDLLEETEAELLATPTQDKLQRVYSVKRDLILLRRVLWPMREAIAQLYRNETEAISETARTFLRDVYDHTIQSVDIVESYREMCQGLTDLYMSAVSHRMNEVMKVLTIIATLFIPITFFAGVYGMNFEHMPELGWRWSYPLFWVICGVVTIGLLIFFYRKGWIGRS